MTIGWHIFSFVQLMVALCVLHLAGQRVARADEKLKRAAALSKFVADWAGVIGQTMRREPPRCGGTIQTAKGEYFNLIHPEKSKWDVEVVAAALSKLYRFTGHCREFYSVAQHAVMASYLVPVEHAYEALHHDDAEAFINDIAKPLKELLPDYQRFENHIQAVVFERMGLPKELPACVKLADLRMLATEQRDLMPREPGVDHKPWWLVRGIQPLACRISAWSPHHAERAFLARHYELLALREIHALKARAA